MLERDADLSRVVARDIMSHQNPRTIEKEVLVIQALRVMKENNITQLLVVDGETYAGVIHLHEHPERRSYLIR